MMHNDAWPEHWRLPEGKGQRLGSSPPPSACHIYLSQGDLKKASQALQPLCDELAGSHFVPEQLSEAIGLLDRCPPDKTNRAISSE